jgi:hypothetical protein
VMALILVVRMIEYVASWDDQSQAAINSTVQDSSDSAFDSPLPIFI